MTFELYYVKKKIKHFFLKLLILPFAFRLRYVLHDAREWYKEVWIRDFDDLFCCSGFDSYGQGACGCYGMTVQENAVGRYMPRWFYDWMYPPLQDLEFDLDGKA